jgi:hypothetical protein
MRNGASPVFLVGYKKASPARTRVDESGCTLLSFSNTAIMLFKSIFISSIVTSALAIYLPEDHYLAKAPAIQEGSCNCSGDNVRYNKTLASDYICGDKRLGPSRLPTKLPLGTFVTGYDRFGGLSPNDFLGKWYNSTQGPDGREAGWIYPEKYGFHLDEEKLPVKSNIDLMPGTLVDRFGYNTGK